MSTEGQGSHAKGQGGMVSGVAQTAIGVSKESSILLALTQHFNFWWIFYTGIDAMSKHKYLLVIITTATVMIIIR